MKKVINLNDDWFLHGKGETNENGISEYSGKVSIPNNVHLTLLEDNVIPDYNYRYNADLCQWVEDWYWTYTKNFRVDDIASFKNARIVFKGLDTYASIHINGEKLADTSNMFISHQFEIEEFLKVGDNVITVAFTPMLEAVKDLPLEDYPSAFTKDRVFTRRMQCTYTWDWVHRFVTYGVCDDVYIELVDNARIEDYYIATRNISDTSAQLYLRIKTEQLNSGKYHLETTIKSPTGEVEVYENSKISDLDYELYPSILNPQLWWPATHGEQPLYKIEIKLFCNDLLVDEINEEFGIRTIYIEQITDKTNSIESEITQKLREDFIEFEGGNGDLSGRSFTVLVNGKRIFLRGGNWVPPSPFPAFDKDERYERYVTLAKDGNINILRVWGGGVYAPKALMQACDRLGVMVCQDFQLACGTFPIGDNEFQNQLEEEYPGAIKKLRNHPSLAWYNGDNELGMNDDFDVYDTNSRTIFDKVTRKALMENDFLREYIPTSPYGGRTNSSVTIGNSHYTCFLLREIKRIRDYDQQDYIDHFSAQLSRFCSEAVSFGTPSIESLKMFMLESELDDDNMLNYHQKNHPWLKDFSLYDGVKTFASKLYGDYDDVDKKIISRGYVQYEWVMRLVKNHRAHNWYSSGIIFWMFNDCWAASGWAVTDWYGYPKAAYYGIKKASKDVIVTVIDDGEYYDITITNERFTDAQINLSCNIYYFSNSHAQEDIHTCDYTIKASTSQSVYKIKKTDVSGKLNTGNVLDISISGDQINDDFKIFSHLPKEMKFEAGNIKLQRHGDEEGYVVVSTDNYARVVCLHGDYDFEDNYFDLLPNSEVIVKYKTSKHAMERQTDGVISVSALNSKG